MTDIVGRLRLAGSTKKISMPGAWAHEAADEIERLRKVIAWHTALQQVNHKEIERLRGEVEAMRDERRAREFGPTGLRGDPS